MLYSEVVNMLNKDVNLFAKRHCWDTWPWKINYLIELEQVMWYDGSNWVKYFPLEEEACADDWYIYEK